MDEEVTLIHSATAIQSLRESDFSTCSAIGEVIDNSIQADAKQIKIRTTIKTIRGRGRPRTDVVEIAFGDDGHGMDAFTAHRCLQLGFSTRFNDRSGIGRFGLGVTLGAINQCKKIEIYSKKENSWLYTYIDLDEIKESRVAKIDPPIEKEVPEKYKDLVGEKSGTLMIWSKIDRWNQKIDEVTHWIARVYRKFIGEEIIIDDKLVKNKNKVNIFFDDQQIHVFDPLYHLKSHEFPDDEPSNLFPEKKISVIIPEDDYITEGIKTSEVIIRMSLTPESFRPEEGSGQKSHAKERYISDNEGISILRANREVMYDTIPRFSPAPENVDRWWSCEICFEPVLDRLFTVKNIKVGARPVLDLREKIQNEIKATITECKKEVRRVWEEAKELEITKARETSTVHFEVEQMAKNLSPPKSKAGSKMTPEQMDEEIKKIIAPIAKTTDEKRAWEEKIKSQPFTIIDKPGTEWKGDTFIDIHPQLGQTIIEYNMGHPFFIFIYSALADLEKCKDENDMEKYLESAKALKKAIDYLFISFAQAEGLFNHDDTQKIGDTLRFIKANWGTWLTSYIDDENKL